LQWIEGRDSPGGAKDFALMLLTTDAVMKRTAQLTFRGTESALQFSLATGHLEILPGKDDDACQTQGGDYTLVREGEVGTFRPSFDCARAKQPRERAICASPELSFLDQRLSLAYRAAELRIGMEDDTARNTKLRQFRAAQDEWYSKTLASCQAADCVSPIYRARIKELESMEPER
jgi:uncharacterized protein YecT (DUF1311 family)